MNNSARRLSWLPPLLVGVATAVAAEVAVGVLLYAGEGLVRALSVVLVVEATAFAFGLWSSRDLGSDLVAGLRRRWLMCLIAFVGAALFGTSWLVLQDFGASAYSQGIGLAVLAALPLYLCGTVLGGLSFAAKSDPTGALSEPAIPAAFGLAMGFAGAGFLLPRAPMPSSLLIGCIVLLSFGGLIFGILLGARLQVEVKASTSGPYGQVRVDERRVTSERWGEQLLLEGSFVRRRVSLDDSDRVPWDVAMGRAFMPRSEAPWRVLIIGGGASTLPRVVLREHPSATVHVLERVAAVVELGRDFLQTELSQGAGDRWKVDVGNLDDAIQDLEGCFDVVLVDSAALVPLGGPRGLTRKSMASLTELVGPTGSILWGPVVEGVDEMAPEWSRVMCRRPALPTPIGEGEPEVVLVLNRAGLGSGPVDIRGFEQSEPQPSTR